MARPSNTDERRGQITRAMVKVMARHGYDGASIGDIAKAARLSPGLVHYHFENKREILLAAQAGLVEAQRSKLEARLHAAGAGPAEQLAAFLDFHLALGADADPDVLACWVLLGGEALRDAQVREGYAAALAGLGSRLGAIVREGVARKVFTCDSVEAATSALVALLQGTFVVAATARELIPRGSAATAARRMAEGLLHPARPLPAARRPR